MKVPAETGGALLRLTPANQGLEREGLWRENMALADINGDGHVDLICPPTRGDSEQPYIYLGNGAGGWMEWTDAVFPKLPYAYGGVDVGDIDMDGRPDIALGCHMGRIFALLQTQAGRFESHSDGLPYAEKFSSKAVKLADTNGDGRLEIIALNESPTFVNDTSLNLTRQKVFTFDGTRWQEIPIIAREGETMAFGNALTVRDFDQDGRPDFATVSSMFHCKWTLFANAADGFHPKEIPTLPDRSYYFYVDSADFNKDGRMDLVYTSMAFPVDEGDVGGSISAVYAQAFVMLNLPDGWEQVKLDSQEVTKSKWRFRGLAVADFDGNGWPDIATLFDDRDLRVFLNADGRSYSLARLEGWNREGRASWMGSADINEDGTPDLVVAYGTEKDGGRIRAYTVKLASK